jgi:hypothetical protein
MKTARTSKLIAAAAALAAILFLSGCASEDGRSLTLKERWKRMTEREDARAAAFVEVD